MVEDDRIAVLSFTGSAKVGWYLKKLAWKKHVLLELGGNAAVIVERDADLDFAVERTLVGGFSYAGQVCISVQRIYLQESIYDAFRERLIEGVEKLRIGDPLDEKTDLSSMITEGAAIQAQNWIEEAVSMGARVLVGGKREGSILYPTVLENVSRDMKVFKEEVFAPVVCLIKYRDFDEAIKGVNDSVYGLQAGVFTRDSSLIWKAFNELKVGGVIANDVPTFRVDIMPYGGTKDSGVGREGIKYAIEEYTEPRLLVWLPSKG
jgi:glyceraldehyde-3-phosphate dehydrogenase (NADP+)